MDSQYCYNHDHLIEHPYNHPNQEFYRIKKKTTHKSDIFLFVLDNNPPSKLCKRNLVYLSSDYPNILLSASKCQANVVYTCIYYPTRSSLPHRQIPIIDVSLYMCHSYLYIYKSQSRRCLQFTRKIFLQCKQSSCCSLPFFSCVLMMRFHWRRTSSIIELEEKKENEQFVQGK